jgi:arginyl-tRNA synthetase
LEAVGYDVVKTQIINDRGVAICKSMLSWKKFGNGQTPDSTGIKSDHFVGDWYVLFEQKIRAEYEAWQQSDTAKTLLETHLKPSLSEKDFFKDFKIKRNQSFILDEAKSLFHLGMELINPSKIENVPQHVVIIPDGNRRWA